MKILKIEPTEFTPEVILDPKANRFVISGESRPENAGKFYQQILDWLEEYYSLRYWKDSEFDSKKNEAIFEFNFEYFNSTSAKFILDILHKIKKFCKDNVNIKVEWHYDAPDLDMKESGEEFAKMTGIPFEFVAERT
ncbi:MAG: DUF1987 domain-containing protein [Bacteroidota bacterium]